MRTTGYWYTTETADMPDQIWALLSGLVQASPDNTVVLVPNRALKSQVFGQIHRVSHPVTPLVYTLDEWVRWVSGSVANSAPLLDAALDDWVETQLAPNHPSIPLHLPGVRSMINQLIVDTVRFQMRRDQVISLIQSRFLTATASDCDAVLSAIINQSRQLGITNRWHAYAQQPGSRPIESLVLIGFNPTLPVECRWLDAAVAAADSVLSIAPFWATTEWNRRFKHSVGPNVVTLAGQSNPSFNHWQCDDVAQQGALVHRLIASEVGVSKGDWSQITLVADQAHRVNAWAQFLRQSGVPCAIAPTVDIVDTDAGRFVMAVAQCVTQGGDWRSVRTITETAFGLGCGGLASPTDQTIQFQAWVRSGVVLRPRWWTAPCPQGCDSRFWTWVHTHVTPILDQPRLRQIAWLLDWINRLPSLAPQLPVQSWHVWGVVMQLLSDCDQLWRTHPQRDGWGVLKKALQQTKVLGDPIPGGVQILVLEDAMTVASDVLIVPEATADRWASRDWRVPEMGSEPPLDLLQSWSAVFKNARRSVHVVVPDVMDGVAQTISGAIQTTLGQFGGNVRPIRPTLGLESLTFFPETGDLHDTARGDFVLGIKRPTISVSRLSAYRVCPRQYALRYHHRATDQSEVDWELSPKEKGIVSHLIVEGMLTAIQRGQNPYEWLATDGRLIVLDHIPGPMGESYIMRTMGTETSPGPMRNMIPDLVDFCHSYQIIAIERPLSLSLNRPDRLPVHVTGVADIVARHFETGVGVVIDIKTSSVDITRAHLERYDHLQLPVYRLGLQAEGIPINLGIIWQLGKSLTQRVVLADEVGKKIIKKTARPLVVTPEFDTRLMEHLGWVVNQIESGDFRTEGIAELAVQTQRRAVCRSCPYIIGCSFSNRFKR